MKWCRAVWKENGAEVEDAVPHQWIDETENILFYPKKNFACYYRTAPQPDWDEFELVRIKQIVRINGITMLMSEHQKLKTDSDYFIDDGHSTVRREKQRTSYPSEDFVAGDISDSTESAVVAFPKPPPPRVFPKMPSRYPTTPKTPYSATLVTPSLATPGTITAPGTPADIVVLSSDNFNQLMEKMSEMKQQLVELTSKVDQSNRVTASLRHQFSESSSVMTVTELPRFKSPEEAVNFEVDAEQRSCLLRKLISLGGSNSRHAVTLAMKAMMSESVMAKMNMRGQGVKMGFDGCTICKILKGVGTRAKVSWDCQIIC